MKSGLFALGLFALVSADAQAQTLVASNAGAQAASSFAGASFGSPIAFGADWGSAGIGVFGQTLSGSGKKGDGSAGVAFGLGDADRYVGLETQVSVSSLSGSSGDSFGDSGALGFKLHTNLGSGAAFAVGVNSTARWGKQSNQNKASLYAVATKAFKIGTTSPYALVANVGIGDQAFQEIGQNGGAGVFGSLAFYFTPQVSIVADYTGRFLNAGISAAPFRTLPFTVTLGAVNVTGRYNSDAQVAMTLGYGFHF
ncbi:hypothetical protein [Stenotrophobium rhamnosiphilum]|uniref:Outer membrane protein beta-barrel domain-containing protein n=1 Tax=Stenotrophobium rhamnosiphilum TaxID=2029166 RepID=A0A2T5MF27_9GAMM|nr:hypothetical protein [Stenotrophobium rhamnosiphilum]PTU31174.1 hypothetical protein CJD38_10930 [Stenotrophobium rhamnosiphilum]